MSPPQTLQTSQNGAKLAAMTVSGKKQTRGIMIGTKIHCVGLDIPLFNFVFARYPVVQIQDRKTQPPTHLLLLNRQEEEDEVSCREVISDGPSSCRDNFRSEYKYPVISWQAAQPSGKLLCSTSPKLKQRPKGINTSIQPSPWTHWLALPF